MSTCQPSVLTSELYYLAGLGPRIGGQQSKFVVNFKKREPKTAKCAEMAGLITWQAAIVFLECFLLPPQLDANYIIMMINVSTTLSSD